jgi:hypothetical protein
MSTSLSLHGRPWIVFDPTNIDHRRWYSEFVKTGTWGRCPYRFIITDDQGNLVTLMQRALVKYYVEQEFVVAKKPQRKVA